jgi:hypothetical protein
VSVLQCWFISTVIYQESFSKDQKLAVSLNQPILREPMGGRKKSTWTAGYEKRMQRLSLLNQRLWSLSAKAACFEDAVEKEIQTPELFFALYWNLSLTCKIKLMQQILIKQCAACYEMWDFLSSIWFIASYYYYLIADRYWKLAIGRVKINPYNNLWDRYYYYLDFQIGKLRLDLIMCPKSQATRKN